METGIAIHLKTGKEHPGTYDYGTRFAKKITVAGKKYTPKQFLKTYKWKPKT